MSSSSASHILETKPVGKLLLQYSIPAIIGMTVTSLYNIIDSVFIGHGVGPLAISGLAITFPLMNLIIAFSTLVGIGGATISSIYLGQKDTEKTSAVLGNVVWLSVINGFCFGGLTLIFLDPILHFFGASPATLPYARDFMQVILMGNPIAFMFIGLNNVMRATGYPRKAMLTSLLTVFANIILAPIFIFHLNWGIRGAALATVISQSIGLTWILMHYLNRNTSVRFKPGIFKLKGRIIMSIFSIGMSPFLMNVCASTVVIVLNNSFMRYGGDLAIGAYGIVNRVLTLFVMIEIGVTQGMQPVVGYNYGALLFDRVRKTLRYALIAGVSIMTFGFLMSQLFPRVIVGMFTDNHELTEFSKFGLRVTCLVFPLVGSQIIITNFFQSIGKAKVSIFLSLSRQLLFLIPFLLILPRFWGITGVWASMPMADFISFVITIGTLLYFIKKGLLFKTNKIVE